MDFKNTIDLYDKLIETKINIEDAKTSEEETIINVKTESTNDNELEGMLIELKKVYAEEFLNVEQRYSALINELDKRVNDKCEDIIRTIKVFVNELKPFFIEIHQLSNQEEYLLNKMNHDESQGISQVLGIEPKEPIVLQQTNLESWAFEKVLNMLMVKNQLNSEVIEEQSSN